MSSEKIVLDSYAVIAYFENEVGAKKVEELLWQAELGKRLLLMSIINWGEVYLPGQEGSNRKIGDELPLTLFFFKVKYKYEKNP